MGLSLKRSLPGIFIVLDGMDGAGKTSQLTRLHQYLFSKDKRIRLLTTREPTSGQYGKKIREMLASQQDPYASSDELFGLYVKDREEHVKTTLLPFLKAVDGNLRIVLCDRYYYSTIAYQHAQGVPLKKAVMANNNFPKPDLAIILTLPPDLALQRISGERTIEKFEQKEFMEKLRANFLALGQSLPDRILQIDSSCSLDETFEKIKAAVDGILQTVDRKFS
ncbi:MAG: dTMP kinase [Nanoarchaeota archaeon]|nr:dTMP kinase [Nanoarchaeota archaeon]